MPVLAHPKHELFAQEVAKGATTEQAHITAGYSANRFNAAALARKPHVKARINEILAVAAEETICTVQDIARQLDEDRTFARELENPSAAISATMGKAKVLGLISEKVEHTGKDGGAIEVAELSETERARRIAFALTRGAQQPTQH